MQISKPLQTFHANRHLPSQTLAVAAGLTLSSLASAAATDMACTAIPNSTAFLCIPSQVAQSAAQTVATTPVSQVIEKSALGHSAMVGAAIGGAVGVGVGIGMDWLMSAFDHNSSDLLVPIVTLGAIGATAGSVVGLVVGALMG